MRRTSILSCLLLVSLSLPLALTGCAARATTAPATAYPQGPAEDPSGLPPPPQPQPQPLPEPAAEPVPQPVPQPPPEPTPPPAPPRVWDDSGWEMLGEQTVDGKRDRDKIQVGRDEGKFTRLTLVVLDSELELLDLEIKFAKGKPFRPEVRQVFAENSRTRVIDLPGDRRVIKWIELRYKNLPGGGRARVQVWGK